MEALKSLRHNFDLDSVHNLSGLYRRLVCVPKFCPGSVRGKPGAVIRSIWTLPGKRTFFYRSAITIIFWQMPCTEQMGTGRFWQITGHWSWMRPTSSRKLPARCMEEALERKMCRKFPIFFPGSIKGPKEKRLQEWFAALQEEIRKHRKDGIEDMVGKESFYFSAGGWQPSGSDERKASAYDSAARREHSLLDLSAAGRDG